MPKKKSQYASLPAVPSSKIADSKLINSQTGSLGNNTPNIVPKAKAVTHAFPLSSKPAHGYGHSIGKGIAGHLRVSGHPAAHHLGKPKIPKIK